ncbi:helix-turn-helix domain-containing protein [Roseococcus sp. YIM B11640]|uniref:helix-turn-helix domain-containing protein n=1 Tax=Roseococcus sp. YIM B11640 TaxID=3133973 RepID=UPI003C7A9BC1
MVRERALPDIVSTRGLPPENQFDAWQGWFEGIFDVCDLDGGEPPSFEAETRHWTLSGLSVGQVFAPALRATRSAELVRRNPIDHWVLGLGRKDTLIATASANRIIRAGTPFVTSLGHFVASEREADERLHIYLPRDNFGQLSGLDGRSGLVMDRPLGLLFATFLRGLVRHLARMPQGERVPASDALRAMVSACIVPTADRIAEAADHLDATRLERVRGVIRRHLTSPELNVAMICRELGLSRSQLYRLLNGEGGVGHYIRRQRLEACYAALANPEGTTPIGQIASAYGFEDPSVFSRVFRREFGFSPSDVRAAAQSGAVVAAEARVDRSGYFGSTLSEQLRAAERTDSSGPLA